MSNKESHKDDSSTLKSAECENWLKYYRGMRRIRKVEEHLAVMNSNGEIPGFMHLSIGQESVPVAVSAHLHAQDTITLTHRSHGQAIAKGMAPNALFAELLGLDNGICRGRGGSMHLADTSIGILGANGIVGGGLPIAVGSALAHKLDHSTNLAVAYFGDGALAEGVFHECFNLCALWALPCLFVCENNGWSEYSPSDQQFCGSLEKIAASFDIEYQFVDGANVIALAEIAGEMISSVRSKSKPQILEVTVERLHGHHAGDTQTYRSPEDLTIANQRDPIALLRTKLRQDGLKERIVTIDQDIEDELNNELAIARSGRAPSFSIADAYAT